MLVFCRSLPLSPFPFPWLVCRLLGPTTSRTCSATTTHSTLGKYHRSRICARLPVPLSPSTLIDFKPGFTALALQAPLAVVRSQTLGWFRLFSGAISYLDPSVVPIPSFSSLVPDRFPSPCELLQSCVICSSTHDLRSLELTRSFLLQFSFSHSTHGSL